MTGILYSFGRDAILLTVNLFQCYQIISCDRNFILVKLTLFLRYFAHPLFLRQCAGLPTKISCEVIRFCVNLVDRLTGIIPPWVILTGFGGTNVPTITVNDGEWMPLDVIK